MQGTSNTLAVVLALTLVTCAQKARAEFETGNTILQHCSKTGTQAEAYCLGYLDAVIEVVHHVDVHNKTHTWCLPPRVMNTQTQRIVVKYLRDNPSDLHRDAPTLVIWAMRAAFPCKAPPITGSIPKQGQY